MKVGLIGIVGAEAKADYWGTMGRIAEIGYAGVEAADHGLLDGDVAANLARLRALGLDFLTTSASREDLRDRFEDVRAKAVGLKSPRVSVWWSPADTKEGLLRDAELYNTAGAKLAEEGIKLCYHNHDQEFRNVIDGAYALDMLVLNTDPSAVYFTIDIGWVAIGGEDPARVLRRLKGRVPAIHVKDFADLSDRASFTTVGTGAVPIAEGMIAARETGVEWAVVEQDKLLYLSAWETVTTSFLNLKERGLV
ncbi:MAG: sugar phosphate isomerase/epimerase [Akkermansiaceae bacterium]|nr:sugar phosphate isomerase/epimerase [Armatimonadota bacterium]